MEILIVALLLTDVILSLFAFFSNRKIVNTLVSTGKLEEKFALENILNLRASLRLISAVGIILSSLLAFLGYNALQSIERNVSDAVKKRIDETSNIELLSQIVDSIKSLGLTSQEKATQINLVASDIKVLYEKIKQSPQKLFVVEGLKVSSTKRRYSFSELTKVDGLKLPKFSKPPMIFVSRAYDPKDNTITWVTPSVTRDSLDLEPPEGVELIVDVWIHSR